MGEVLHRCLKKESPLGNEIDVIYLNRFVGNKLLYSLSINRLNVQNTALGCKVIVGVG